ncbi:SulP family inorganic anion transporter [Brachybacterium saurashtrense]|uniref:SulP family inorganic anion transporter n=1 Tax=Brachybacterium saurashtrense TaxID=556288 RepID=A0A345YLW2_9MICO|nr:SulP family inorganic anion transporter [Brachybacterium saurashtrense]AXK44914.1 SulP family inorganic anion transporter [Brachybacterium saurashtrense]RRR21598.1 SulP family inorganic anion transporter [Brachybacterium saurashtrense]
MLTTLRDSLRGYRRASLRSDIVAGLTVWAVLIPESLAYASIAGVSPVVGLYAAIPALLLYPLFGSSRHLVVGPMSATAAMSAGVVGGIVSANDEVFVVYTAGVAVAVGVMATVASLFRLGFIANFISEPVLKGFIVGMALVIVVGQLPKFFGVEGGEGNFFARSWAVITSWDDIDGWTTAVATGGLLLLIGLRRFAPRLPGSLIVVVLSTLAVLVLDLQSRGVATVGTIEPGLPRLGVPAVEVADVSALISGAAGVMLVGFAEGLGAAKTYAQKNGYRIDANRELLGLGGSNLGSGFLSGMVVNGSLSKTAVNGAAGARTQLSGYVVAMLTVLTLLFLTPLFAGLPEPTLAAVVIAAVVELIDIGSLRQLYRVSTSRLVAIYGRTARADFLAASATLLGVLVFDTLPGLVIGVMLSVLLLLFRVSTPHMPVLGAVQGAGGQWADRDGRTDTTTVPGVVVVRVEGPLVFANADAVQERLTSLAVPDEVCTVVLDAAAVPMIDVSAARMLHNVASSLQDHGTDLVTVGDVGQVRDVLRTSGEAGSLLTIHATIEDAVDAATSAWGTTPGAPGGGAEE